MHGGLFKPISTDLESPIANNLFTDGKVGQSLAGSGEMGGTAARTTTPAEKAATVKTIKGN
jgi:hypothetical protein